VLSKLRACQTLHQRVPALKRLVLAGHSEGAAVCLLMLTKQPDVLVDAFIILSGPGKRFFDVMLGGIVANLRDGNLKTGEIGIPLDLYERAIELVRLAQLVPRRAAPGSATVRPSRNAAASPTIPPRLRLPGPRCGDRPTGPAGVDRPGGADTSVTPGNAHRLLVARKEKQTLTSILS
jgi:pimeloyl-ACP methyl ester carboxylesterase